MTAVEGHVVEGNSPLEHVDTAGATGGVAPAAEIQRKGQEAISSSDDESNKPLALQLEQPPASIEIPQEDAQRSTTMPPATKEVAAPSLLSPVPGETIDVPLSPPPIAAAPMAEPPTDGKDSKGNRAAVEIQRHVLGFAAISPGLSNVALPLGPSPRPIGVAKTAEAAPPATPAAKPVEPKVGDLVEMTFGRGQVRAIREDDMVEVDAVGWELSGEQRPRFVLRKDAVKVVPTVYYQMPVLDRLQISAWLKEEGTKRFKDSDMLGAVERYMKAVSILKTCDFKTNAHNARALEVMIPCLNNTATCKIKLKEYKDATLLSENVDSLCSALERNRDGLVLKSLKERGVTESKVLGQWWGKGLYLGGRACMNLGDNEKAVACFKKAIKVAKPSSLAKLRDDITVQLEVATKRLASQTKKAKQMWGKAFKKNSTEPIAQEQKVATSRALPSLGVKPQFDTIKQLEELARRGENGTKSVPVIGKVDDKVRSGEDDDGDEYEAEEYGEEALSNRGWIWGTIALGVAAAGVAAAVVLSKRRSP